MRDDFPKKTRQALALRAAYRCSFDGCDRLTVGPSDESTAAVAVVGVAAHIQAAASGGPRYDARMTPDERKGIENGIWLCSTHASLVDRDQVAFTVSALREMKRRHEVRIAQLVCSSARVGGASELIAIGPDVICVGDIVGAEATHWIVRVDHFVTGDLPGLTKFGESVLDVPRRERFVVANELGDGRVLAQPLSWRKAPEGLLVTLGVETRFPRTRAQELGADLALGPDDDLATGLPLVSGVDALAQRIKLVLWHQEGRGYFDRDFGTRIPEYFHFFGTTPWFSKLVLLEAIRMASIPHQDELTGREYTPFTCVERIYGVELLEDAPVEQWLRANIRLRGYPGRRVV